MFPMIKMDQDTQKTEEPGIGGMKNDVEIETEDSTENADMSELPPLQHEI